VSSNRLRRVALTGGIATGKSTVRSAFERLGVPTLDADLVSRDVVAPGSVGLAAIVAHFGPAVLDEQGALDRQKMAALVFDDVAERRALEAIVHPEVRRRTEAWFGGLEGGRHRYALAEIPLLYEVGRDRDFDRVVVVSCSPELQLHRLMERDRLSEGDARRRIAAQWPIGEKAARAHHVIATDAGIEDTVRQVERLHMTLSAQA